MVQTLRLPREADHTLLFPLIAKKWRQEIRGSRRSSGTNHSGYTANGFQRGKLLGDEIAASNLRHRRECDDRLRAMRMRFRS